MVLLLFSASKDTLSANGFSSERADYGQLTNTRKNSTGGYDYYSQSNTFLGHSESNFNNGYNYYNSEGNKIGSLKEDSEGSYTLYNANQTAIGRVTLSPSKKFIYQPYFSQNMSSLETIPGEDLGSINFLSELQN